MRNFPVGNASPLQNRVNRYGIRNRYCRRSPNHELFLRNTEHFLQFFLPVLAGGMSIIRFALNPFEPYPMREA